MTAATCACAHHDDDSTTTMLCPLHAPQDPCATMAAVTGKRRQGSIRSGTCSNCGWSATTTPVPTEVPVVDTPFALNATHRCDRCGAQAFVATQHEGSELLWCAHHYTEHETKLDTSKVVDERARINLAASISANST